MEIEGNTPDELSDCDREHIAEAIIQGFTGGEIVVDEEEEEEEEEDSYDRGLLMINRDVIARAERGK